MKVCSRCKTSKTPNEFRRNISRRDGLHSYCKTCASSYDKSWYQQSENRQQQIKTSNQLANIRSKEIVLKFLNANPCVDCGENDLLVLEFDHVSDKKYNISRMINQACSEEALLNEISKCQVRCCNCHRRKTAKQFGSWRLNADIA